MDFHDYKQELDMGVSKMRYEMERETKEMQSRLERINQQIQLIDWLSSGRHMPATNNV